MKNASQHQIHLNRVSISRKHCRWTTLYYMHIVLIDRSQSPSTETESQLSWLLSKRIAVSEYSFLLNFKLALQCIERPSYRDFFMAMTFLAHTRSKDNRYQVCSLLFIHIIVNCVHTLYIGWSLFSHSCSSSSCGNGLQWDA